jgi:hypothetical protein
MIQIRQLKKKRAGLDAQSLFTQSSHASTEKKSEFSDALVKSESGLIDSLELKMKRCPF